MRSRLTLVLAAAGALVALGLLGGCAPAAAPQSAPQRAAQQATPADFQLMMPADKQSKIASNFPLAVPVPAGTIESGEAQGGTAWDYVIVVPASLDAAKAWYRMAYERAEWTVIKESADSISLVKNAAESQARFEPGSTQGTTRVTVTVGVGTSVLRTQ